MSDQEHHMLAGSHERLGGAECKCGAAWSRWDNVCAATAPWDLLSDLGKQERVAVMERTSAPEAVAHVAPTGHAVQWSEDCHVWACLDCSWVDSNFVPTLQVDSDE